MTMAADIMNLTEMTDGIEVKILLGVKASKSV